MNTFFKIRRIKDGTFSTGGMSPRFTKKGKTWNTKQALHAHLGLVSINVYTCHECELVELQMVDHDTQPLTPYLKEYRQRKLKEKQEEEAERVEAKRQRELQWAHDIIQKHENT